MMRRLAAAAVAALFISGSAFAQEGTVPGWTGPYIGLVKGVGFGTMSPRSPAGEAGIPLRMDGFLIGGVVGWNLDVGAGLVLGVEADYAWANIAGEGVVPMGVSRSSALGSLGTARGRVGWGTDRFLVYGTAGFAWANSTITRQTVADTVTATGWAGGVGLEGVLSGNWTGKFEALWYNLGADRYSLGPATITARQTGVLLRGGLTYRFNWGATF